MVCAQMISLVRRLVPEEGREEQIFKDLFSLCDFVSKHVSTLEDMQTIEWLFVLRMLSALGYVKNADFSDMCNLDIFWTKEYLGLIAKNKDRALSTINAALSASQL